MPAKKAMLLALCLLLFCPVPSRAKINEKEKFTVRVIKVKSVGEGCNAEVQSDKVRYEIRSGVVHPCKLDSWGRV